MALISLFKPECKHRYFVGKAACFVAVILFLSGIARADVYEKIDELSVECQAGNEQACAELSEIAKKDSDGGVRLAAAVKLSDKSLAQAIFANIAKYDKDEAVRLAAVKKLTDKELLANLAKYGKDSVVRLAAERKLTGQDLPAETAETAEGVETAEAEEEAQTTEPAAVKDLKREGVGKKMGIASFMLRAGINIAFGLGVKRVRGDIYEDDKDLNEMTYLQYLRRGIIKASESVLKGNDVFQYIPAKELTYDQSEEAVPLGTFFYKNALYGALSVKATLGVCIGWKKKVNMTTVWEITNSSGYEVSIKTYSKSKEKHGVFPDTQDPELEAVFIDLARENTQQFLEKLAVLMEQDENFE
jgi:hypothetical protein